MASKPAKTVALRTTAYLPEQIPVLEEDDILFLGRSNAGKSSLLNALTEKDLARVSKNPGKTRSINFFTWGQELTLVDLPGYGFADRSREERDSWKKLVESFFDKLSGSGLGFLLMDAKRNLEEEEWNLGRALMDKGLKVEILLTKADRLNQSERTLRERQLLQDLQAQGLGNALTYRFVSVKTGEGVDAIRRQLFSYGKQK